MRRPSARSPFVARPWGIRARVKRRSEEDTPMRWRMGWCLGVLLCLATVSDADDRKGSPFDNEHWEGRSPLET